MADLSLQTVSFLIDYLAPDADDWGPRVRDALTELRAYELNLLNREQPPLVFRPVPTMDPGIGTWHIGRLDNPLTMDVKAGSELALGLSALHLALASPGRRIPLLALDPRPLQDKPTMDGSAWARTASRARSAVIGRAPLLARALRRCKVHRGDPAVTYGVDADLARPGDAHDFYMQELGGDLSRMACDAGLHGVLSPFIDFTPPSPPYQSGRTIVNDSNVLDIAKRAAEQAKLKAENMK